MSQQSIPVVQLGDFLGGDESKKQAFVKTVGDALVDIGFFALEDHGVESSLIKKCYKLAEDYFSQDQDTKVKDEIKDLGGQRGFTNFGKEHAKNNNNPDLKEFWHVGREFFKNPELAETYPKNIWPNHPADFKQSFNDLYSSCLLYTSPSPRDATLSRMPSSA